MKVLLSTLLLLSFVCFSIAMAVRIEAGITQPAPAQPYGSSNPYPMPTPQPEHTAQCDNLKITSGNQTRVPTTVKFEAQTSDNRGSVQGYRFYFGDGKQLEVYEPTVEHRYESSGTFEARFEFKDSQGKWRSNGTCQTNVTILPAQTETHRSSCSDIMVTADNDGRAPSTVRVKVTGFDNKGEIQHYRVKFADGVTKESNDQTLEYRYEKAGTYVVTAEIKDSMGNWMSGSNCKKTVYIETEPLTKQPETGTPTLFTAVSLLAGTSGVGLQLWHRRKKAG